MSTLLTASLNLAKRLLPNLFATALILAGLTLAAQASHADERVYSEGSHACTPQESWEYSAAVPALWRGYFEGDVFGDKSHPSEMKLLFAQALSTGAKNEEARAVFSYWIYRT